ASLHFCSECNNLLYPKAEQQRRTMVYACRICPSVDETVDNGLVYRNDLLNVTKEQAGVTTDLGQDPTLAHTNIACPNCSHEEYVLHPHALRKHDSLTSISLRAQLGLLPRSDKLGSDGQTAESNPT
ncbi:hypothetical protein EDB89DRAFT_1968795, partial [Lactarius sanguifluus]